MRSLVLKPHDLIEQNRHAMREDGGKFLFVAGAPFDNQEQTGLP